jgi:hypothetical protein
VTRKIQVAIEATPKKAFATAVDWPGWSRSGKTAELALEALAAYAPRYAPVAKEAGESFPTGPVESDTFEVIEQSDGGGGTEFGIPSQVTDADRRRTTAKEADRLRRLVAAAWTVFDRVAATAPAELRKGPRGGGRDRDKMIGHVIEADGAYAREIGLRLKAPDPAKRATVEAMRAAVLDAIGAPSDGSPLADRKWTARYAASRIAWHALDHAWEMEDRSEPG